MDTETEGQFKLLISQKAEVADVIKLRNLDPLDFQWKNVESSLTHGLTVQQLVHKESGYYFRFDQGNAVDQLFWGCFYSPGTDRKVESLTRTNWQSVRSIVGNWATALRRELQAKDPWGDVEEFTEEWTSSNAAFSSAELQKLDAKLDEVQQYLIDKSDASERSIEAIKAGIKGLKESARTVGKKDWALMFMGWFFGHCADWTIGQSHWQHIVVILLKGTRQFLIGS